VTLLLHIIINKHKGFLLKLKFLDFTGDVAFRILDNINRVKQRGLPDGFNDALESETRIYVCDINPNMLNVGKQRAAAKGK
jgi:ubiquinone/menaquinone biosynthesis C-methylase UbiE